MVKIERLGDAPITIGKYTDFDEIKADEYRYWQSRPRMNDWMRSMK
jgi:hypothetical protein